MTLCQQLVSTAQQRLSPSLSFLKCSLMLLTDINNSNVYKKKKKGKKRMILHLWLFHGLKKHMP